MCEEFHVIPRETAAYTSMFSIHYFANWFTLHLLTLFFFFLFHYEMQTKVIVHFLCKREWQDKDGEARDVSSISQPPEPQEPIGDSLYDVSCFEVSISQFDPGHF